MVQQVSGKLLTDPATTGLYCMNINSALGSGAPGLAGNGTTSSQASGAVAAASQPFAKLDKRLQADVDMTTAKLSKFGLLKSAVAGGQTAARTLGTLPATATVFDVTVATGNFFNAFNAAITAAKVAASSPGTTSASQSANRVINDFKRALAADPATQDALKKLGLAMQKDGTLIHDPNKFAAALTTDPVGTRAALSAIGKKVDTVAAKELASAGTVDAEISSLTQHQVTLAAQQKAMKALVASMTTTSSNGFSGGGLAAYQTHSRAS